MSGEEYLRIASVWSPGTAGPSPPGTHSFWARLIIVEEGFRPIAADEVVVVIMDGKLSCRVLQTAFTLHIHMTDVVRMLGVQRTDRLELHVPASGAPSATETQPTTRMYLFEPFEARMCRQVYRVLRPCLSSSARAASVLLPPEDTVSVGTSWRARKDQAPFFAAEALAETGFYEVALGEGDGVILETPLQPLPSPSAQPNVDDTVEPTTLEVVGSARSPEARQPPCTGGPAYVRPVRIHHAMAPPEWRTDLLRSPAAHRVQHPPLLTGQPQEGHCERCHDRLERLEKLVDAALADKRLLLAPRTSAFQLSYGPVTQL